jgi:hypothetical protein
LPALRISGGVSRILGPHIAAVLQLETLSSDTYERSIDGTTDTASFHGYAAGLYVRTFTALTRWFGVFGQAGGGAGLGVLTLQTQQTGVPPTTSDTYFGYLLGGSIGCTFRLPRAITFYLQGGYDYAPIIHDRIGDTHDAGGFSAVFGLRVRWGNDQ